jgi:hypothetical protein
MKMATLKLTAVDRSRHPVQWRTGPAGNKALRNATPLTTALASAMKRSRPLSHPGHPLLADSRLQLKQLLLDLVAIRCLRRKIEISLE